MSNTLREIITEVYNLLGEEDSSTIFDKDTIVIPKINEEILNVCKWYVKNILTGSMIRSSLLWFLYKEDVYKIPRAKTLTVNATIWDTTLSLDSLEWLPSSWFLFIFGMFLEYTITWTTLTLTEALTKDIEAWEKAKFAIQKPIQSIQYQNVRSYETNKRLEYYNFQDRPVHTSIAYTIKPYEWNDYLIFDCYEWKVIVPYIDRPTDLDDLDAECILPDNYWVTVIAWLVAWPLLINDQQPTKWQSALLWAYSKLLEMYNFYASPLKERRKTVKVKPMYLPDMY